MSIVFSDVALARSIGSHNPELIAAAAEEIADALDDDIDTGFVLRFGKGINPGIELAPVEDEIQRLLDTYDSRGNLRRP